MQFGLSHLTVVSVLSLEAEHQCHFNPEFKINYIGTVRIYFLSKVQVTYKSVTLIYQPILKSRSTEHPLSSLLSHSHYFFTTASNSQKMFVFYCAVVTLVNRNHLDSTEFQRCICLQHVNNRIIKCCCC